MAKIVKLICILSFFFLFVIVFPKNTINASYINLNWSSLTNLPISVSNNFALITNTHAYNFGGANFTVPNVFMYASKNIDGTINGWDDLTTKPASRYWHSGVTENDYVYLLGGNDESISNVNWVTIGKIQPDGDIISWTDGEPLPQTLSIGAGEIINNKIYYAGGVTNAGDMYGTAQSSIYMSDINSDGTIGSWVLAGNLYQKNFGMKIIAIGNYLYEIGGYNNAGGTTYVRRALINSDGTIGVWEDAPTISGGIAMFGLTRVNNYLFIVGGDMEGQTNKVFYSIINSDDTISNWNETTSENYLPEFIGNNAVTSFGNKIYSIGGFRAPDGYQDDVFMTEIIDVLPTTSPTQSPSPSPSPTNSPTPSSSPTPTPPVINKVFFAPGLGGSWNLDAIINCKTSNYQGDWTLAPFAKQIYQPFIDGVNQTNWKLSPFYYDWRVDVRFNGQKLKNYIDSKTNLGEKVNFVGHSMGGLVGRSYMETNSGGKFNRFISVGSPHQGAVDAYPVVNGEIWNNDLVQKIAEAILIRRCGVPPSIKNLLPTFDYLKDSKSDKVKSISKMKMQNNYLNNNFSFPFWNVNVGTLSGNNNKTLRYLGVKNNLWWSDGKPVEKEYSNEGDGTVLLTSSQLSGAENIVINQTHAGLIGSTEGTNKILDFFGTPPIDDPTFIEPNSALVIIGYPGNFWIKDKKGKVMQSDQGIVSIINPDTQDFDVKIIPQKANTLFIIAQFLPNGETKYKEYKYWGFSPISKKLHFNRERPKEDICNDR